jgi:hypothetical protein
MRRDRESAFRSRHTLRPIGAPTRLPAAIARSCCSAWSLTACIKGVTQPPPLRGVNSIGAEARLCVDRQKVATCGRSRAWLRGNSFCKARMAKLRPEHGSIAATLGRSARGIEFRNQAIGFTNREFANRDRGPHSHGAKCPGYWLCKTLSISRATVVEVARRSDSRPWTHKSADNNAVVAISALLVGPDMRTARRTPPGLPLFHDENGASSHLHDAIGTAPYHPLVER